MVDNITEKVVKRRVQVTSAMNQDGENRVGLIKSETAFKVSQKMAEASATRPEIVVVALHEIAQQYPEILETVLEVMEVDKLLTSNAAIDIMPSFSNVLIQMRPTKVLNRPREPRVNDLLVLAEDTSGDVFATASSLRVRERKGVGRSLVVFSR